MVEGDPQNFCCALTPVGCTASSFAFRQFSSVVAPVPRGSVPFWPFLEWCWTTWASSAATAISGAAFLGEMASSSSGGRELGGDSLQQFQALVQSDQKVETEVFDFEVYSESVLNAKRHLIAAPKKFPWDHRLKMPKVFHEMPKTGSNSFCPGLGKSGKNEDWGYSPR